MGHSRLHHNYLARCDNLFRTAHVHAEVVCILPQSLPIHGRLILFWCTAISHTRSCSCVASLLSRSKARRKTGSDFTSASSASPSSAWSLGNGLRCYVRSCAVSWMHSTDNQIQHSGSMPCIAILVSVDLGRSWSTSFRGGSRRSAFGTRRGHGLPVPSQNPMLCRTRATSAIL